MVSREKGKEFTGTTTGLLGYYRRRLSVPVGPQRDAGSGAGYHAEGPVCSQTHQRDQGPEDSIPDAVLQGIRLVNFDATGKTVAQVNKALLEHKIFGGRDLSSTFPSFGQSALYCVTETKTVQDIDKLVRTLGEVTA